MSLTPREHLVTLTCEHAEIEEAASKLDEAIIYQKSTNERQLARENLKALLMEKGKIGSNLANQLVGASEKEALALQKLETEPHKIEQLQYSR